VSGRGCTGFPPPSLCRARPFSFPFFTAFIHSPDRAVVCRSLPLFLSFLFAALAQPLCHSARPFSFWAFFFAFGWFVPSFFMYFGLYPPEVRAMRSAQIRPSRASFLFQTIRRAFLPAGRFNLTCFRLVINSLYVHYRQAPGRFFCSTQARKLSTVSHGFYFFAVLVFFRRICGRKFAGADLGDGLFL